MKLKKFRKSLNLTAAEVARTLGVTYVTYWKWELGKCAPSLRNARKIVEWSAGKLSFSDLGVETSE